jgi:hypothetical protein
MANSSPSIRPATGAFKTGETLWSRVPGPFALIVVAPTCLKTFCDGQGQALRSVGRDSVTPCELPAQYSGTLGDAHPL